MEELKPCPFCGGVALLIQETTTRHCKSNIGSSMHHPYTIFWVKCGSMSCNRTVRTDKTPIREDLPILIMEGGHGVGADFRKSWVNHFKGARYYLFEKAHHFFYITEHERFNKILEEFIQ